MRVKGTIPVGIDILKGPLSKEALTARANDGRISVNVIFSLDDLMTNDINGLNDLSDERVLDLDSIVGSLSDIIYTVVGHLPAENKDGSENYSYSYLRGAVIININADVSDIINEEV
jgi:hypothetical protein